jgi:PAS domain S-box-containing protein
MEAINDAVVAVNEQGRIITFNAAAERMFGHDRQAMLDQPLDVLMPLAYREQHPHNLERYFSGDSASSMIGRTVEVPARRSDGREFYIELTLSLWHHKQAHAVVAAMRDITERKRAEEALRQSEERYRTLAEHQGEAVIRWLPDTTLTYANKAYARLFGSRPEALLGKKFIDLVPPDLRGPVEEHIRALLNNPGTRAFECPVRLPDGQGRWYRWSDNAVVGELGEVMEVQSLGLDITERKQVEQELRESEARFRDLSGLLPQTVFETDTMGHLTFTNRVGMELFGLDAADMERKMNVFERVAEQDRTRAEESFLQVLAGETLSNEEFLFETKNGFRFRGMVSSSPVFRKDQILGMRGVVIDISDRVAVEDALRKSERQFKRLFREYQALLDGIPDSIALIGPDRTVLRTNMETARVLDRLVQELPGQDCCALWQGCSVKEGNCPVTRSFATGQPHKVIVQQGEKRTWEVRTFPIRNRSGQTVQVIRYAIDITRQVQLREEALRAGQLASLGELAAGVAHEINNPINGIINYAQLLVDDFNGPPEDRDILCGIIEEGDRIANIVRNLLSFARSRKEHKASVGIWDILSCSLALTESQLRKDGIHLEVDVAPDLPPIIAHAQEIQQVVLNLISNARYALNQKYPVPHPDKVFRIAGQVHREGDKAVMRLIFHDHGCGIPRDIQYKVMDPFFTTKPSGQGTGLGLSISHGIIEDHGGRLRIETEEEQFTMVTIDLPIAEEEAS